MFSLIFPVEDKLVETKIVHGDGASMKEGYGTSKEVTFEENPLFIVWKKPRYELWIRPNYEKEYIGITIKSLK